MRSYKTFLASLTTVTKRRRSPVWSVAVACAVLAILPGAASIAGAEPAASGLLRVCADPANMPFSNAQSEGFENKLAELIAQKLDVRIEYSWFAEESGYVPNTMGSGACDLVMGYAQGTGLIEDTNPYYYTSYVLIYREDDFQSCRCRKPRGPPPQGQEDRLLRPDPAFERACHPWACRERETVREPRRRKRYESRRDDARRDRRGSA